MWSVRSLLVIVACQLAHYCRSVCTHNADAEATTCASNGDLSRYSSFQCTAGGNQQIPENWHFYDQSFTALTNRVCMFKNVCLSKSTGHLKYFQHPEERKAPEYAQMYTKNIVLAGILDTEFAVEQKLNGGPLFPVPSLFRIYQSAIPAHMSFIDNKTWVFSKASLSFNFAHILLDDLFPAIAALDIFNIDLSEGHAMYTGCDIATRVEDDIHPFINNVPADILCENNFRKYGKLIFGKEATPLQSLRGQEPCFKQIIIGHGGSLSMAYVDKQRGVTLRKGRDAIIKNLNLQDMPPPKGLSVIVLTKPKTLRMMCEDIENMVHSRLQMEDIPIICINPGDFSMEEEIELIQSATLIVAVHGTTSDLSLFARNGTVLISIGQENEQLKEGQTLLYATHINTFYTTEERTRSLPNLIRYGLFLAATNLQIPFTY